MIMKKVGGWMCSPWGTLTVPHFAHGSYTVKTSVLDKYTLDAVVKT